MAIERVGWDVSGGVRREVGEEEECKLALGDSFFSAQAATLVTRREAAWPGRRRPQFGWLAAILRGRAGGHVRARSAPTMPDGCESSPRP